MLGRAERHELSVSLLLTDIDHFKKINDSYGHPTGDEVLRRVAAILKASARKIDIVARYGGEEFALVLEGTDRRRRGAAGRAHPPGGRGRSASRRRRGRSARRCRSASPAIPTTHATSPRSSRAPTRRSTAPSTAAATAPSASATSTASSKSRSRGRRLGEAARAGIVRQHAKPDDCERGDRRLRRCGDRIVPPREAAARRGASASSGRRRGAGRDVRARRGRCVADVGRPAPDPDVRRREWADVGGHGDRQPDRPADDSGHPVSLPGWIGTGGVAGQGCRGLPHCCAGDAAAREDLLSRRRCRRPRRPRPTTSPCTTQTPRSWRGTSARTSRSWAPS